MINDDYDDRDYSDEPDEGEEISYEDDLGVTWQEIYYDGEWHRSPIDPSWDYVYNEYGSHVSCPSCGADELRYHDGQCCCIFCGNIFSIQEIDDYAGEWFHQ